MMHGQAVLHNDQCKLLTIDDIKRMHDKAYEHAKITRERAADDTAFYWLSNWDETTLGESSLGYKGEFNIVRKAGRQIIGDLRANPVQVNFYQRNEDDDSGGDLVDGMYRTTCQENTSIEAFDNSKMEKVVCGVGGWELYAEYETSKTGDKKQVIKRRPIHEFNNVALFDPGAVLIDKSDSGHTSLLVPYSRDGMEKLGKELMGEDYEISPISFKDPEHSYTFPWVAGQDEVFYAVRFYHRVRIRDYALTLTDQFGQEIVVMESRVSELLDELKADGYTVTDKKETSRYKIMLYIANGEEILDSYEIPGENIPVVPDYGERAIIEGEEHWEGVTRLAKDPQRLRNFQMSYLADIVSRTPRPQPIFTAEQLQGYESLYDNNGADSYLPYLLQNGVDDNGDPLPLGPVGQMPEQPIPMALVESINLSREAVSDVAPANVPQEIADIDLSGKALGNLQNRLDEQSVVYQQNHKHALRRDAEIFASMASVVYDSPRDVTVTKQDGKRSNTRIMDNVIDIRTGELVTINDITGSEFDVFADIGPDYKTKKEETFNQLDAMIEKAVMVNPQMAELLFLKQMQLFDGVDMTDVREYARKQAIIKGYVEPDTDNDEEMQLLEQSQQNQAPDPNVLLAQAEQGKADAAAADVQRKAQLDQFNAQNEQLKTQVNQFDAATRRLAVQVDAQEANANMEFKRIDTMTKRIDAINKGQLRASVN